MHVHVASPHETPHADQWIHCVRGAAVFCAKHAHCCCAHHVPPCCCAPVLRSGRSPSVHGASLVLSAPPIYGQAREAPARRADHNQSVVHACSVRRHCRHPTPRHIKPFHCVAAASVVTTLRARIDNERTRHAGTRNCMHHKHPSTRPSGPCCVSACGGQTHHHHQSPHHSHPHLPDPICQISTTDPTPARGSSTPRPATHDVPKRCPRHAPSKHRRSLEQQQRPMVSATTMPGRAIVMAKTPDRTRPQR